MVVAEHLVAQSYPVYDYRLASDPVNPLALYDCLIPRLREQSLIPVQLYSMSFVEDLNLRLDLKHMEERTYEHENISL